MKNWLIVMVTALSLAFVAPNASAFMDNNQEGKGKSNLAIGSSGIQNSGNKNLLVNGDVNLGTGAGGDITQNNTNNNTLNNTNTLTNTNNLNQQQQQQQQQGQFQTSTNVNINDQDVEADADATAVSGSKSEVNISDNSTNTVEDKRDLPSVAGGAYATNAPAHFDRAEMTGNLAPAKDLTMIRKTFTIGMLRALESGEKMDITVKAYQSMREKLGYPKYGYKGLPLDAEMTILLEVPSDMTKYDDICYVVNRTEKKTLALSAIAGAAVEAFRHGADTFVITGEGAKKMIEAGGWGIMLGGSGTFITGDGGNSASGAVIAPGIGYAEAWSGYTFSPWTQGFGLKTK